MAERTVAAIATPNAAGGIGIVRISGGDALSVASKVFVPAKSALTRLGGNDSDRTLADVPGYTALFGTVVEANGEAVDQAICLVFRAPASYTGEDVVELQCHGGMYLMQKVLRRRRARRPRRVHEACLPERQIGPLRSRVRHEHDLRPRRTGGQRRVPRTGRLPLPGDPFRV